MGRPLNKKFFGNRNTGSTSTTADNYGIGGEGVASVDNPVAGSININNTYPSFPALTATAPTLPTGVTATFAVTWEVDTVVLSGGTGYTAGTITSLTGLDGYATTPTRFTITQSGGVPSFNAFTNRGEYTSISGTGITTWAVVRAPGDGAAQATIKFRVKSIAVSEKGSGYVSVPSLSWGALGGTTPSGNTPVLTTDSGWVGSDTNEENAIQITAWVPATADAGRISGNGTSAVLGDIVRQSGSNKYIVRTAQGVGRVKLVAATPAKGQATIIATDSAGGTYYVTELRGRKAHIIKGDQTGTQFTTGTAGIDVPWTFNDTSGTKVVDTQPYLAAGVNVKIANA
jgi:hypothetical protein